MPALASGQSELATLADLVVDRLDEVVDAMIRRVYQELPFYAEGNVPPAGLHRSVRSNLLPVLRSLSASVPLDLTAAQATGRERAEQDAPLHEVLRAFRIGFENIWYELVETSRATGTASDAILVDAATTVWRLAGECTEAISMAYRESSMELAVRLDQRRFAMIDALFLGTVTDTTTLWEVAEALGMPLAGRFLVVVTGSAELPAHATNEIDTRLRRRGVRSTWRWQPDGLSCLLHLGQSVPEKAVLAGLESDATTDMGVSELFQHLRDTPEAVHGARVALTTLTHGDSRVVQYDSTPLAMLVSAAPAEAERVASAVFGDILALKRHESVVLIRTLRAWCASDGSSDRAAAALHCHANTVRYRLRRIETLTERSLRNPQDVAEIVTALNALRVVDW